MLKKSLTLLSILFLISFGVFAEENTEESIVSPFFSFSTKTSISMEDNIESIDIEVDDMTLGLEIAVTETLTVSPYLSNTFGFTVSDISGTAIPEFNSDDFSIGIDFSINPMDLLTVDFGISNDYSFAAGSKIALGLSGFLGFTLAFEEIHLELGIEDAIGAMFTPVKKDAVDTELSNELCLDISFNFFNFIKEDLNSGLFISNTFTTDDSFADGKFTEKSISNELSAGLFFNPFDFFDIKFGVVFGMEWLTDDKTSVISDDTATTLGLTTEVTFYHKSVSFNVGYEPTLYSKTGSTVSDKISHSFSMALGVSF